MMKNVFLIFISLIFSSSAWAVYGWYPHDSLGPNNTTRFACATLASNGGFVSWTGYDPYCKSVYAWASASEGKFSCASVTPEGGFVSWTNYDPYCKDSTSTYDYFLSSKKASLTVTRLPDESQIVLNRNVLFPPGETCITVKGQGRGFLGAQNECTICVKSQSHNDRSLALRTMIVSNTELSGDARSVQFTVVNDPAVDKISCASTNEIRPTERQALVEFLETMGLGLTIPPPQTF